MQGRLFVYVVICIIITYCACWSSDNTTFGMNFSADHIPDCTIYEQPQKDEKNRCSCFTPGTWYTLHIYSIHVHASYYATVTGFNTSVHTGQH